MAGPIVEAVKRAIRIDCDEVWPCFLPFKTPLRNAFLRNLVTADHSWMDIEIFKRCAAWRPKHLSDAWSRHWFYSKGVS